jgi:Tol biopolymer transport system component
MKKIIIIGLILLFSGCTKEDDTIDDKTVLWRPVPVATIDNNQIKLTWLNYSIFNLVLLPYTYVTPDNFDIYISEGTPDNFRKLTEVENDESYSFKIKNLKNGQACYIYVVSKKKRYSSLVSDTIMAIPNPKPQTENLITVDKSHTIIGVSLASKKNKIAYVDKFYSWYGGENCCMAVAILTSNIDGSETELIDVKAFEPDWSPDNDKIVFRSESNDMQIAVYDTKTKEITELTDGEGERYAPVFSKNGEFILFESPYNSNVGFPGDTPSNIWMINTNTSELTQITDIYSLKLKKAGRPDWIDNDKFLFNGTTLNYKSQIYEASVTAKQVTQKIVSDWNDYCPSVSPDNKNIAFISDRSGSYQIWLYSTDTGLLKQVTGFPALGGVNRWWNRIEWMDSSNILFTLSENRLMKLKID